MNKEEALAKLCQYSTCNYKEQIWAPEAKELLEYWTEVEKQIKQLQQENNQLKEQRQELRSWLEDWLKITEKQYDELKEPVRKTFLKVTIDTLNEVLSKLNELEGKNE